MSAAPKNSPTDRAEIDALRPQMQHDAHVAAHEDDLDRQQSDHDRRECEYSRTGRYYNPVGWW